MAQGYTSGVPISTDTTMSPGSNTLVPSQLAVKTYAVPYTGATGNVDLGSHIIKVNGANYPGTSSSGKILISDGTNYVASTPTFPGSASATSRKITVSDGTNWVASTETYATPGSAGQIMRSDGTNWTSSVFPGGPQVPTQGLQYCKVVLTSAQIKAIHATPITLIAAQGAGTVIVPVSNVYAKFTYGGNNVFVAGSAQTIAVYYGTTDQIYTSVVNSVLTASASNYSSSVIAGFANKAITNWENVAVKAYNSVVTEISGNAANDNTLTYSFFYYVITL